jgi:transaldolase
MAQNEKLAELSKAGVAVWLDDLSRDRIRSGNLQSLIDEYSVVGVTTNPTIFAAAISGADSYDDQVHAMAVRKVSVEEALRTITAADVRDACDLLAPVAQRTGRDGRVSLEVSPGVARDTDATAAEAAHLWWLVDRPNLYIKIPATQEGLPAITTSIAAGISVNVTLIFSPERYRAVVDAYLSGLEQRVQDGGSVSGIESVASFFVSRVDTEIDKRLEKAGADRSIKGKAALANAQLAYHTLVTGDGTVALIRSGRCHRAGAPPAHRAARPAPCARRARRLRPVPRSGWLSRPANGNWRLGSVARWLGYGFPAPTRAAVVISVRCAAP